MLYVSTTLQPVGATVSVVRMQLAIATIVALVAAFALAFALARNFSQPVEGLTRKARTLAGAGRAESSTGAADAADSEEGFDAGFCAELDELAGALDEASVELSKVEEQRAEFLANISHDLRTPLTLMRGYAEAAHDDAEAGFDVDPEDLAIVAREATRLGELVNDLLDYSKLKGAGTSMEMASFDASEAFRSATELFAPYCERVGLAFGVQIEPGIAAYGDEAQLARVACNLIDNAISHTPEGGSVDVELELLDNGGAGAAGTGAGERAGAGAVRFSVRDSGPGIAPDEIERVWERYFTKKQAARNVRGSGLGLAISREILEAHGARYGAESELGEGSTFWFELNTRETLTH